MIRLASYNVAWFDALFDNSGALQEDQDWSGRRDIRRSDQIAALGHVFRALEADAILVVEAPDQSRKRDTGRALSQFAARFDLRCREVVLGFANDTQQEIALMYDPDRVMARHDPQGPFHGKAQGAAVQFSKPPLELALSWDGGALRLIGVHLKSKAPHGARNKAEATRMGLANRRKQLAQAVVLRARVVDHLVAGDPLVVMGDLNDGPGVDHLERVLGQSSVEIIMGLDQPEDLRLHDPNALLALHSPSAAHPASARFFVPDENRFLQALLDYIMVCPCLLPQARGWRIWHPFEDRACMEDAILQRALLMASDHFPVTLDLAAG